MRGLKFNIDYITCVILSKMMTWRLMTCHSMTRHHCRIVFNNFTVGFLNMLVFQTVWRNKNEHKTKIKMEKEEKSVFKFTRNLPTYDYEALHPSRF